jgi:hypothetical protein
MRDMFATIGAKKRPMSVMEARDPEVLSLMLDFYAWPEAKVLDVTANERRMWKGVEHPGGVTYADIDPAMNPDIVADFRALPCDPESYDVIVFDPPHLPAAAASPESDKRFAGNYGLSHAPKADNISSYFRPFLDEAARVLRHEGLIFVKLKDFVHNHVYQWMLAEFIHAVRFTPGLTPCDLIVKRDPSAGSLQSSKWINTHHVRNAHCWWIIVRKGRCETRRKLPPQEGRRVD